ncbi:MAG: ankyrin repeat domain-containing protein [Spirochaetia bacterium]|nr:ankyrin repeat domain-containing protein [Spirochaetia bacterium]MDY3885909.1 hypothetical protein [Treponema sp.]
MKNKEIEYGNITLGKINKMLISFIGESTFYYYYEEFANEGLIENWQSKDAFQKYVNRLVAEEDSDYSVLRRTEKNGIPELLQRIIKKMSEEYPTSGLIFSSIIGLTYGQLYERFLCIDLPVCETSQILKEELSLSVKYYVQEFFESIKKEGSEYFDIVSVSLLPSKERFSIIYDWICSESLFKNKETFYKSLADSIPIDKEKDPIQPEHFKQIITNQIGKGKNPEWKNMKQILDFLSHKNETKALAGMLLEAYICRNIEEYFYKKTEIAENELSELFNIGNRILSEHLTPEVFDDELTKITFNNFNFKEYEKKCGIIQNAITAIMEDHIYLHDEKQASDFINDIKDDVPYASSFFCSWLEGYIELSKDNYKGALNRYLKAFEARKFAGKYFELFIKQAAALAILFDSDDFAKSFSKLRETKDPRKNRRTPLSKEAKKFWNYGYALEIFSKSAEDTFIENIQRASNFSSIFPTTKMFPSDSKIHKYITEIILNSHGIGISKNGNLNDDMNSDYKKLLAVSEENINKRIRPQNNSNPFQMPIISVAILYSYKDKRFRDLLDKWFGLTDNSTAFKTISGDIISDNGQCPLLNALECYRQIKFVRQENDELCNFYKVLCKKLIDITSIDFLLITSTKSKYSVLDMAINTCDIELVELIVEKLKNINDLKISADELSPLYYTLARLVSVKFPDLEMKKIKEQNETSNINWKNLNVPGMTDNEKMEYFFGSSDVQSYKEYILGALPEFFSFYIGKRETYPYQTKALKEIALYLLEKTENPDSFILENTILNQSWTALFMAVETDEPQICKALIEKGANPNLILGKTEDGIKITFLRRCIAFKAYNVLEMFLKDFKHLLEEEINEHDNELNVTPLTEFLSIMLDDKQYRKDEYIGFKEVNKFIDLFRACGANFDIESKFGSANELLKFI